MASMDEIKLTDLAVVLYKLEVRKLMPTVGDSFVLNSWNNLTGAEQLPYREDAGLIVGTAWMKEHDAYVVEAAKTTQAENTEAEFNLPPNMIADPLQPGVVYFVDEKGYVNIQLVDWTNLLDHLDKARRGWDEAKADVWRAEEKVRAQWRETTAANARIVTQLRDKIHQLEHSVNAKRLAEKQGEINELREQLSVLQSNLRKLGGAQR